MPVAPVEVVPELGVDGPAARFLQAVAAEGIVGVGPVVVVVAVAPAVVRPQAPQEPHAVAHFLRGESVGPDPEEAPMVVALLVGEGELEEEAGSEAVHAVVTAGVARPRPPEVHARGVRPEFEGHGGHAFGGGDDVGRFPHRMDVPFAGLVEAGEGFPQLRFAERLAQLEAEGGDRPSRLRFREALDLDPVQGPFVHGQGEHPRPLIEAAPDRDRGVALEAVEALEDLGHGLGPAAEGLAGLQADGLEKRSALEGRRAFEDDLAEHGRLGRLGRRGRRLIPGGLEEEGEGEGDDGSQMARLASGPLRLRAGRRLYDRAAPVV